MTKTYYKVNEFQADKQHIAFWWDGRGGTRCVLSTQSGAVGRAV